jgi:hypothetical protein
LWIREAAILLLLISEKTGAKHGLFKGLGRLLHRGSGAISRLYADSKSRFGTPSSPPTR